MFSPMAAESNYLLSHVAMNRRQTILTWVRSLEEFEQANDRGDAAVRIARSLGVSVGTFYRERSNFKRLGIKGLMTKRELDKAQGDMATYPAGFLDFWMQVCGRNQRRIAPAWRDLVDDHLVAGKVIPGYSKDWRGIWAEEHPDWAIPEACPYSRGGTLPHGWSQRSLTRHAVDAYQRIAMRQGTMAARNFLPGIPSTRVGLPFGRVYVIDDVEWDLQVMFSGNMKARGVVELGALELLTAHYCTWGAKPIRERANGTREKLSEDYNRYLIAHIACGIGFSTEGCLICGEHGTAKLPADLQDTLARASGGMIKFAAGGILNQPIAAGLYMGASRGNFRFKAALESRHNLKKNDEASIPGQKGPDPEHAPEDLPAKEREHHALMKACVALAEQRPDLIYQLSSSFPLYERALEMVQLMYDRIENRIEHNLEGWVDCGFTCPEWKLPGDPIWKPISILAEMDRADAEAIQSILQRNESCNRHRRMSPAEAFRFCQATRQQSLTRLPECVVPQILGLSLADRLPVQPSLEITVPDRYIPQRSTTVAACVKHADGTIESLERGREYLIWLNPLDGRLAFIANLDGAYLGVAPVITAGTKVDSASFARNLKIVSAMQSTELKKLAPIAEERLREQAERAARNVRALTGKDVQDLIAAPAKARLDEDDFESALHEAAGGA